MSQLPSDIADAIFNANVFDPALAHTQSMTRLFRNTLENANIVLEELFFKKTPVDVLLKARAFLIDELLIRAWRHYMHDDAALIAVGGYGRSELHPHSDIDLLIALKTVEKPAGIENFVTFLWDIGLQVGHSVRTLAECETAARQDITIFTNLLEARFLVGDSQLFTALQQLVTSDTLWPMPAFFQAKREEQANRYGKYNDTEYNLEPNIKGTPGGLRDLQLVMWLAIRKFSVHSLQDLIAHGFLTPAEYHTLMEGQTLLWELRFALHLLTGKAENRLLFDYQLALAKQFGYHAADHNATIEQFMKHYYRAVKELRTLIDIILQFFEESLTDVATPTLVLINPRFQIRQNFLEVSHAKVFAQNPSALLEIFLLLAQNATAIGIRAATLRLIRENRSLIDDDFRYSPECQQFFMAILREPHGLTHALMAMNRYGILGGYIVEFGNVVGQMQYDLFHTYTVDMHTLFVVRNLRRFLQPDYAAEFPLCAHIMQQIPHPEVLYLAALFHDIGKGRGGDHATLGAKDATQFCERHHLDADHTADVAWLTENHLLMSLTAQRKDINDMDVIHTFANTVGSQARLDYLYLLTVADISATNKNLWNSWRDSLLKELYAKTQVVLEQRLEQPSTRHDLIQQTRLHAQQKFVDQDFNPEIIADFWERAGDDYFLRYTPDEIYQQTAFILKQPHTHKPLILIRQHRSAGATDIFIYTKMHDQLFAAVTSTLDRLRLTVVEARIIASNDDYSLDTFTVLEENMSPISNPQRMQTIQQRLQKNLQKIDTLNTKVLRLTSRRLQHFSYPTQVNFSQDLKNNLTLMEIISPDRPGLLARIGQAFAECHVLLKKAKIATFGERVEDVFFITTASNEPITDLKQQAKLEKTICRYLDSPR